MVACVAAITQAHLKPVLQDSLDRFPFVIRGFHSDNGSEFINDMVSGLLRDLLIEQTAVSVSGPFIHHAQRRSGMILATLLFGGSSTPRQAPNLKK